MVFGHMTSTCTRRIGFLSCYYDLQLRYVDVDYPSAAVPLILESGTTPDVYPPDYYGCPYAPGNAVSPCIAPPTCNVDGNGKFVAPPCIE